MSTGGVKIGGSYDEARTRKTNAEAQIAELELAKVKKQLVMAEHVVSAWTTTLTAMKAKLLSIPTKAAPILSAESNAGVCQKILDDLIDEALEELSNYRPEIDPVSTGAVVEEKEDQPEKPKRSRGRPKKVETL